MITYGKHSYIGLVSERFNPVVRVGKFCSIGSGVVFYGICQHPQTVSTYPFVEKGWIDKSIYPQTFGRGDITIGNDVWFGEDVTVMDGITIGDGVIVGARTVVASDIPPYTVAVGNPWKVLRMRFAPEQIVRLLKIKWWDWEDEKIKQEIPYMRNIEEFLERKA